MDLGTGLQTVAEREEVLLAPYAMRSRDSLGRKHPQEEHPYRGPFQRDRDRIIHCSAFRRLSGKMQVFTGEHGDYHRTRLTHSHEVTSIARTIGRALRLNEDLIEALALFHDIGHPPYGHSGEDALDDCLRDAGGFSHNRNAITIAEELEKRYPGFPGLNLTQEVLDSQATRVDKQDQALKPLLEAQVVDVADSATYDAHDTDDALKLGLVTLDELAENALVREILDVVSRDLTNVSDHVRRTVLVRELVDRQVSNVLQFNGPRLQEANFTSATAARTSGFRIQVGSELAEKKLELERFLYARVYRHPELIAVRNQAQDRIRRLFDHFTAHPDTLPDHIQRRIDSHGISRSAGEYIAGMTDRFCDNQYEQVCAGKTGG